MAEEKTMIVHFGVPESVYNDMVSFAAAKGVSLDQLCSVAVAAGLAKALKLWKV